MVCVCVCLCVCVWCGLTQGGEAKWDPAALRHLACRKWEGGESRGGNNMEKGSSSLLFSAQGPLKPDMIHWWDTISGSTHLPSGCARSVRNRGGGRWNASKGHWKRMQRFLFILFTPHRCSRNSKGQKGGCCWTFSSRGLIHPSSDHSFSQPPIHPSIW